MAPAWTQRAAILALTYLCISAAHAQQPPSAIAEVRAARHLATIAQDDASLDQSVSALYGQNLPSEKRAAAKASLRSLLLNERLPAHLVRLIRPVLSPTLTEREAKAILAEGMASLKEQGLRRLPTERLARYVRFSIGLTTAIPAEVCKAMALKRLDTAALGLVETRYSASLPLREFEAFIALGHDAAQAELAGYPDVKTVNQTQAQAAERAYAAALQSRAERLPPGLLDRTQDLATAEPAEVCLLARESLTAALDLAEPYRGWWLSRMFGAAQ